MYTPTAGEAQKWAQAISDMSRVINRKIVAGVERRRAPDPPGGPSRPPSCPPDHQVRMTRVKMSGGGGSGKSDSCEDFMRIEYVKRRTNLKSSKGMAVSVPDSLDKIGDDSYSLSDSISLNSRLWLDGSPPLPPDAEPPVYPKHAASVSDLSWTSRPSSPVETDEPKLTSLDKGGNRMLSTEALHVDNQERSHGGCLYQRSVSVDNLSHPSEEEEGSEEKLQPRSSSLSTQQARPVPKPRKGKVVAGHGDSEQKTESNSDSVSSLQPPAHPRTESLSKKSKRPSSIGMRPRKGSGLLKRKLSPPSLPPPPPPKPQSPSLSSLPLNCQDISIQGHQNSSPHPHLNLHLWWTNRLIKISCMYLCIHALIIFKALIMH